MDSRNGPRRQIIYTLDNRGWVVDHEVLGVGERERAICAGCGRFLPVAAVMREDSVWGKELEGKPRGRSLCDDCSVKKVLSLWPHLEKDDIVYKPLEPRTIQSPRWFGPGR